MLHVPHLIDVEFLHAMRKLVGRGLIGPETASAICDARLARAGWQSVSVEVYGPDDG